MKLAYKKTLALYFKCRQEVLLARILGRAQRPEDNKTTFEKRMERFKICSTPVIHRLQEQGKLTEVGILLRFER